MTSHPSTQRTVEEIARGLVAMVRAIDRTTPLADQIVSSHFVTSIPVAENRVAAALRTECEAHPPAESKLHDLQIAPAAAPDEELLLIEERAIDELLDGLWFDTFEKQRIRKFFRDRILAARKEEREKGKADLAASNARIGDLEEGLRGLVEGLTFFGRVSMASPDLRQRHDRASALLTPTHQETERG